MSPYDCIRAKSSSSARRAARASGRAVVRREGAASPFSASAARFAAREARHSSHVMRMTLRSAASAIRDVLPECTQLGEDAEVWKCRKTFRLNPKEIDVHPLIEKVAQSFKLTLANRGGVLETRLEASPSVVVADEMHLTNLIFNLIDNGIKYSTDAPHITVATSVEEGWFRLSVSDQGIGISKDDQRHVFEKFYRVSTGDVHNVKGFGIGLNYVAQVVKLHQGHIALESELGKGSTFTVSLPVD